MKSLSHEQACCLPDIHDLSSCVTCVLKLEGGRGKASTYSALDFLFFPFLTLWLTSSMTATNYKK